MIRTLTDVTVMPCRSSWAATSGTKAGVFFGRNGLSRQGVATLNGRNDWSAPRHIMTSEKYRASLSITPMGHAHRLSARSETRLAQSARKRFVSPSNDARTSGAGRRTNSIARAVGREASTMTGPDAPCRAGRLESVGRLQPHGGLRRPAMGAARPRARYRSSGIMSAILKA